MKFKVIVELEHVSGPESNEDALLDAFAAAIGRDNTANPPLTIKTATGFGEPESVYVVKLIDA